MKDLSASEILSAPDLGARPGDGPVPVDVPEWGGRLFVRVMGGAARDEFDAEAAAYAAASPGDKYATMRNVTARIAARTVCDSAGALLFSLADVAALALKSSRALERVYKVAARLNGLTGEDVAAVAGKSETSAPSGGPGSDTPPSTGSPSPSSSSGSTPGASPSSSPTSG